MPPTRTMRAVGAKVAVGVTPAGVTVTMGLLVSIMVTIGIVSQCNAYGYFYRTQVAPRLSAQAHGARLALLLRLQRDNSLLIVYLGRCPRLYTVALSARVGYSYVAPIIMVEPVWAVPKFLVVGNTHGVACGKLLAGSCNRGSRPLRFPEPSLACWEPSLER